jgi:type IV pilus assembly protein PilE
VRKGFTLMELIIVVIIIAILASIALPSFFKTTGKAKQAEANNLLGMLRSAQLRYYAEFEAYSADCGTLDASYTTPKYFTTISCAASDPIASVSDGTCTKTITANGDITPSGC